MLEATGVEFEWDWQDAGADVYEQEGTPLPDRVLESIRRNKVAMKAPITTPVGSGFRSVNVALRKELDLYCLPAPVQGLRGRAHALSRDRHRDRAREPRGPVRGHRVRGGLAGGGEAARGRSKELSGKEIRPDSGISIKPISIFGTRRIVRAAFDYARENGRRKVTAAHKANIMKFSDGLFLRTAAEGRRRSTPDIEFEDRIIDNLCNQLVSRPEEYDVIVLPNLYGDIVSDLGAGMSGGLGMAPGGNIGDEYAVFEATHGSAPKYKGMNKVNPTALMLSGVMMLRHLGERDAADRMEKAIAAVIAEGSPSPTT